MKLKHTKPCAQCPWRKESVAGWLGGHNAEDYADPVAAGEVPACHMQDHGPENEKTAFCAGALACMKNQAMTPKGLHRGQESAPMARDIVGKNPQVFWHHSEFYKHHSGKDWVPPFLRKAK